MSDKPVAKAPTENDDRLPDPWVMPNAVFRSSEGTTPKNVLGRNEGELDATLEPAPDNREAAAKVDASPISKTVDPVKVKSPSQETPGSWTQPVLAIVAIIVIGLMAVAAAIVYLYYSSSPPDTFQ